MNSVCFYSQIKRLSNTFGERNFPEEKVNVIWKYVEDLKDSWFSSLCDKYIGTLRHAPLPADFLEEASIEKKKNLSHSFADKPHPIESSIFSEAERSEMFQVMKDVCSKKISPSDARKYASAIQRVIDQRLNIRCKLCHDTGQLFALRRGVCGTYAFRCQCDIGLKREGNHPIWQDGLYFKGFYLNAIDPEPGGAA
jgi:hypothetical protein